MRPFEILAFAFIITAAVLDGQEQFLIAGFALFGAISLPFKNFYYD